MKLKKLTTIILLLLLASMPTLILNIFASTIVFAEEDDTPPSLHDSWVSPVVVVAGESVTVYFDVTDDLSGVESVNCSIETPSGVPYTGIVSVPYNETSGLYELELQIPESAETGYWIVAGLDLTDNAGNYVILAHANDIFLVFNVVSESDFVGEIWASDASGNPQDSFVAGTSVYVTVPKLGLYATFYVVSADSELNDGDTLTDVSGDGSEFEYVTYLGDADNVTFLVWAPPTAIGNYYAVMDANNNGIYDAATDCVDTFEIESISVIPEVPFGTIMASFGMIAALVLFVGVRRSRSKTKN